MPGCQFELSIFTSLWVSPIVDIFWKYEEHEIFIGK